MGSAVAFFLEVLSSTWRSLSLNKSSVSRLKLSLCLNQTQRHEDVLWSEAIESRILDLDIR